MPHVLLATYHYYPYFWGGSEVYVKGLVDWLLAEGWKITLIAGLDEPQLKNCVPVHEDSFLNAGIYEHEGVRVIGVANRVTKEEIYSRYHPAWKKSWTAILQKIALSENPPELLHLHAYSPLINRSLVEAVQEICPGTKTVFSYHIAESCPKGSLTRFNRETCDIRPSVSACTACVLNDRLGISPEQAKWVAACLPDLPLPQQMPSILQTKRLTRLSIESYERFARQIDKWLVFSRQAGETIARLGVENDKITMIRHGIASQYADHSPDDNSARAVLQQAGTGEFVFIGRFKKVKGILTLLEAWLNLAEQEGRNLTLVGDDQPMAPAIARLLTSTRQRKDVRWLGFLSPDEIKPLLRQAHCLIVPSEVVETGPLVLHEAVACGVNIIASDVGGAAELCEYYGKGCHTFPLGDANALTLQIEEFRFVPLAQKVLDQQKHYAVVMDEYRQLFQNQPLSHTLA